MLCRGLRRYGMVLAMLVSAVALYARISDVKAGCSRLNRPGIDGGSEPRKGWSHGCTEEVSR